MKSIIDRYLDRVLLYANKPEAEARAIRRELEDHLLQEREDLIRSGVPEGEAAWEAVRRHGAPKAVGYGLRGGFPWIDIRAYGTARGVIAIGPKAVGIFAFGNVAFGIFACGGISAGLFSSGGVALGLLFSWGGLALGGLANGGMAMGLVAMGGMAIGVVAAGGMAIGAWAPFTFQSGNGCFSYYTAKTVPHFLRIFDFLLTRTSFIEQYFCFIIPIYILAILVFGRAISRERKRVASADDWMMEEV